MMPTFRSPLLLVAVAVLGLAASGFGQDKPKTIILGFDGMDQSLTEQYIDAGLLPSLAKLRDRGTFQRLETSNPAQSPVSWAVFNTGQNPGKTGVGGFVSRYFGRKDGVRIGSPLPQPMLGFKTELAAERIEGGAASDADAEDPGLSHSGIALGALLIAFVLFKFVLKLNAGLALVLGLAAGYGSWVAVTEQAVSGGDSPDGMLPYEVNPMQGTNFWKYLDEAGVRMTGVQIASTFPPDEEGPNTRLLSGLGVKDISGTPGSFYIYTDDPWAFEGDTGSGGSLKKLYFEGEDGLSADAKLTGPRNWFAEAQFKKDIAAFDAQMTHADNTDAEVAALEEQKKLLEREYNKWTRNPAATVPFSIELVDAERSNGRVTIRVGDHTVELGEGDWTDFLPVVFPMGGRYDAHGIVRFHLQTCSKDEVRLFVPPINIDPYEPPSYLPISSPPGFSRDIAEGIDDHYETLGWACMTNPLKDHKETNFTLQSFLDDIVSTMSNREQILAWGLADPNAWEVYYQVFSTTDRIGHMLFREADPEHPAHDAEYAATTVNAWGRSFPISEALPEVYKEADRIVGGVLERIEAGEFGGDCLLMIVADHGFTSFRWGVNLNNALAELGFLAILPDAAGNPRTVADLSDGERKRFRFVDWENTKAYSLGLGKVFINLAGREPHGIVAQADYSATVAEISAALEALTDPDTGTKLVTSASPSHSMFSGPWVDAGKHVRRVRGEVEEVEHDGMADIFLGYEPYHRVSWENTLGGLDKATVTPNTNHWSGGHVSVDPVHVAGVFLSNRKLAQPAVSGLIDIGPTLLARYGLDPEGTSDPEQSIDGAVLPFENLTR